MHRRFPLTLVALVLIAGCNNAKPQAALEPVATVPPAVVVPTTEAPVVVPTTISPTPSPTPKPATYDVKAVQTQLTALHYYVGPIDGERGASLRSAVMAFQKVQGLVADGGVGPNTLKALKAPKKPVLKGTGAGTRVEVDLTKQVLYLVKDGAVARILPVSSGNGKKYLTKSGHVATALSPVGYYKITRRIIGERHADLGTLYDPQYFYKGWAIHGSNSVPAHPASHGCVRVTRADAKYLLKQIGVGTAVYIYGGAYTFTAGSSAPGTDDPGGDTAEPTPTPAPTTEAPTPTSTPTPTESPTTPPPTILPTP